MSIAELKKIVDGTNREERSFLAAYLRHVERRNDRDHRARLDELGDEFSSGPRFSLEKARDLHARLEEGDR